MAGEKLYCGSAKARDTQYGEELTVSVNLSECERQFKEHGYVSKSGNNFITLKVQRRKEVGKYGETHTVIVDTWKPENRQQGASNQGNGNGYQNSGQNASTASQNAIQGDSSTPPDDDLDIPF